MVIDDQIDISAPILIVDDKEEYFLLLQAALEGTRNCHLIHFTSGLEALELLESTAVAAIVLEVEMSGMNGFETADKIRELSLNRDTPLFFISTLASDEEYAERAYDLGAIDILTKPVSQKALRSKITFFAESYLKSRELDRKLRAELESSEHEKALLLETSLDAVIGADESNRVIYWNQHAEKIFGWSKSEILGREMTDLIMPARFREGHRAGVKRFISTGVSKIQNRRIEIQATRRDGEEFPVELTVTSVKTKNGFNFYSFIRDITERVRAQVDLEKRLAAEQEVVSALSRLQLISDSIPDLIAYVGSNGRYEFANAAYEVWLGRKPSEVIGRTMREVLGDRFVYSEPHVIEALAGREVSFDAALERDGKMRRLDARYIPDLGADQKVKGFVIVAHDITEIQESRELAQNQNRILEFILNKLQTAVMLIDPHTGEIKLANQAAQNMTGGLQHNINQYGLEYRLLDANGKEVPREMFPRIRASRGEKIFGAEYRWVTPKGSWDYLMYSDLIPEMHGQPETALLSFLDITELKQSERNAQLKEQELRVLSNSIPQLAWMAEPDGAVFWYNERWYEYTGTTPEEMKGWGWQKVHHQNILPDVMKAYERGLSSGEPGDFEFPLRSKSGEFRWFLTRWIPLKDDKGNIVRWFGTNTDIHDERLVREDQKFRADLVAQLNASDELSELVGLATKELAKYLRTSRCFVTEISGLKAKVHTDYSKNLPSHTGEYDLMTFGPKMVKSWRSGEIITVSDVKTDLRTKNDSKAHLALGIRSFITVPLLRSGNLVGAVNLSNSTARDWSVREVELTRLVGETVWASLERVHLLAELKRSTKRSHFLARASSTLNSSLDTDEVLRKLSDLAVPDFADWCSVRLLGGDGTLRQVAVSHVDTEKVKWAWELQQKFPPDREAMSGPYEVVKTGKSEMVNDISEEAINAMIKAEDQRKLLMDIGLYAYLCVPIKTRTGTIGALSLATTRESGKRYSEEDLRLAQQLGSRAGMAVDNARLFRESQTLNQQKDEFLATLSHELRTPMNVIQGYADLLKAEENLPQDVRLSIEAIHRNAKAQTEIITDLLEVSSIITGKITFWPVELSPLKLVAEILEGLRPSADAKGVTLELGSDKVPETASGDPFRIQQIVSNLVTNAIKFTDPGGVVRASVRGSEREWLIEIFDSGIGIAADFLPHVFDRFRQEDASTKRYFGGLGLGLSIAKNLVELHGGTISVESEGRGRGTKFTLVFPLLPSATVAEDATRVNVKLEDSTLTGVKVLLVEDSPDNRVLVARILKKFGAEVIEAEGPAQARERLRSFKPDIIVSDIGMPEENGMEFISKLRSEGSPDLNEIPAVALTAYVRQEEKEAALKAGFQAHVSKPFSAQSLVSTINDVLG